MIYLCPWAAQSWAQRVSRRGPSLATFRAWLGLAKSGISEAQFQVARSYLLGTSVPQSYGEALKWFRRSALQGHSEAQTSMALLAMQGFVAHANNPSRRPKGDAIFGFLRGTEKSPPRFDVALAWARLAAAGAVVDAQALLGYLLSFGPMSMRDTKNARVWLERAASCGSPRGALALAMLISEQDDSEKIVSRVLALLALASDGGLPLAARLLAISAEYGLGQERNLEAAVAQYKRAAGSGDPFSQVKLGLALMTGIGTSVDRTNGETWLRRSALSGDPEAAALLGELYLHGIHVPQDYINAQRWLEQAAQSGHRGAIRTLGIIRLTGFFGIRDTKGALETLSV